MRENYSQTSLEKSTRIRKFNYNLVHPIKRRGEDEKRSILHNIGENGQVIFVICIVFYYYYFSYHNTCTVRHGK